MKGPAYKLHIFMQLKTTKICNILFNLSCILTYRETTSFRCAKKFVQSFVWMKYVCFYLNVFSSIFFTAWLSTWEIVIDHMENIYHYYIAKTISFLPCISFLIWYGNLQSRKNKQNFLAEKINATSNLDWTVQKTWFYDFIFRRMQFTLGFFSVNCKHSRKMLRNRIYFVYILSSNEQNMNISYIIFNV